MLVYFSLSIELNASCTSVMLQKAFSRMRRTCFIFLENFLFLVTFRPLLFLGELLQKYSCGCFIMGEILISKRYFPTWATLWYPNSLIDLYFPIDTLFWKNILNFGFSPLTKFIFYFQILLLSNIRISEQEHRFIEIDPNNYICIYIVITRIVISIHCVVGHHIYLSQFIRILESIIATICNFFFFQFQFSSNWTYVISLSIYRQVLPT